MKKDELSLLRHVLDVFPKVSAWARREQTRKRGRQEIENKEMDIAKIEAKANAEIQIIREKTIATKTRKLLIIAELKERHKLKYGGK